ncbi:hypothetical protein A3J91_02445 [Candidatus Peribacteria bacterium RIFOXYC2_FULL_58_10]|nr:MAG: hypothetical protein A3J91_02445 [Candidatus Peribacteria bacterium RIFOXYC2_FULL_58_10]OGJ85189.1 MAG: hypothetical protein A2529_01865 [Candidatus Peribacteria bacterium RIFOXYD2_FULL_58_15]
MTRIKRAYFFNTDFVITNNNSIHSNPCKHFLNVVRERIVVIDDENGSGRAAITRRWAIKMQWHNKERKHSAKRAERSADVSHRKGARL